MFKCKPKQIIFSAKIEASQGFSAPEPLADITGWTVWKQDQTEIYRITHNLGLTKPSRQLHIVATPMDINTTLNIYNIENNHFTISTWGAGAEPVPKESAFMFIATLRT